MSIRASDASQVALPRSAAQDSSPEYFFEQHLRAAISPGDHILDAGCGAGKFFRMGLARQLGCHVVGADLGQNLRANSAIDFAVRANLRTLPFANNSFDVVNCRLVIEHLDAPKAAFQEFHRVLKPGGRLAVFTPNLLHYFGAAARCTPHWFHLWFNSKVRGFDADDIFPTYYRANTRRRLRALLRESGFNCAEITLYEGAPSVLAFNRLLHAMGVAYERLVKRFEALAPFRLNIVAIAHKESDARS
jgi:SAM-dependent methyltransferase